MNTCGFSIKIENYLRNQLHERGQDPMQELSYMRNSKLLEKQQNRNIGTIRRRFPRTPVPNMLVLAKRR